MAGDFFQLSPVPNAEYRDYSHYRFMSPVFSSFPHTIELDQVLRQQDDTLISCINQLARGQLLSDTSLSLLTEVSRPLYQSQDTIVCLVRNYEADVFNAEKLGQLQGEPTISTAKDSADLRTLKRSRVPKHVASKLGAPVVLTANLADTLFNGLLRRVHAISSAGPLIKFDINGCDEATPITPHLFSMYSPTEQKVTATRKQLPLLLAFGMAIHKCQGITLPSVEVHCKHIFAPGQLGVAVGRATHRDGLRVVGFTSNCAKEHHQAVIDFYQQLVNADTQGLSARFATPVHSLNMSKKTATTHPPPAVLSYLATCLRRPLPVTEELTRCVSTYGQ
ncbi:PREDICTED: ATP-dependent DNA helicase PIF1-like [Priapulus caudatus]|uniref:ATP-dependent DNA helicase PIF1-like n=1 Tax=Priapulus caudatus TaxID=37621 RepID=A0ABM1EWI1_PRICU|nr:PREDICTED: ATP-dependent DNA helicase PIF1-like [Priapulus caudatus]